MSHNEFELDVVSVRLVNEHFVKAKEKITGPESAIKVIGDVLKSADREVVGVINLATDGTPINYHIAGIGILNTTLVEPREMLKASILSNAAKIIMVHNHPSGDLKPSKQDIMITDRMAKVCDMVGIPLIDHVIVGGDNRSYFSFNEKGIIPFKGSMQYATELEDIRLEKTRSENDEHKIYRR